MPANLRPLGLILATLTLGSAGGVFAQSNSTSPFLAPAATAASAGPNENLEFAGVNAMVDKTYVNIFDKGTKKSRWVAVGGSEGNLSVLAYDPRRDQVVVKSGEIQKTLTLRKATGVMNAPTPVAASFNTQANITLQPVTTPLNAVSLAPVAVEPTASSQPVASTPAATPPPAPDAPAKPMTVARQEEEARMLVSDLLEIGMAQRKAYEEAAKKAQSASPNGQQSATATTNTATPPGS